MSKLILTLITCLSIYPVSGISQWILQDPLPQNGQLNCVFAIDNNKMIAGGYSGTVMRTLNGGQNWNILTGIGGDQNYINSIFFANEHTGWVAGTGFPDYQFVLKSTDDGSSWFSQTSNLTPGLHILNSIYFTDENNGWAGGGYGAFIRTTNGGLNWIRQNPTGSSIYSVFFIDVNTGWLLSGPPGFFESGGEIFKSTNGGINWIRQYYGTGFNDKVLISIFFADAVSGWASGYGGDIYKTINGGTNWIKQTSSFTLPLYSIFFYDNTTGWAVGAGGKILKTTNGGSNWFTQISGTTLNLRSIFFSDNDNGWVVGDNGVILKTTNGGSTDIKLISNEVPESFEIEQNYPNPFNPSTKIKFHIPQSMYVNVKVFDILGNEIAVLVNSNLKAGSYEVEFIAQNISSGIYFYNLQTDHIRLTKRMLLLK